MATDGQPIRVVLADDSYLVREALEHVLHDSDEVEVVASCGDRDSLLKAVDTEEPDVVVTDIRMPPSDSDEGLQVAAALRLTHPQVGVVVLSQFVEPHYGLALLETGSEGRAYLLKERIQHGGQLLAAIEAVSEGGSVIDSKVVESLVTAQRRAEDSALAELTPRELEILECIADGFSNKMIARELDITDGTVKLHVKAILRKLGMRSRVEAAVAAVEQGLGRRRKKNSAA